MHTYTVTATDSQGVNWLHFMKADSAAEAMHRAELSHTKHGRKLATIATEEN